MPIRRELRHLYRGPKWEAVRKRILGRANNRCEQCGKPNGVRVETFSDGAQMFWRTVGSCWHNWGGLPVHHSVSFGEHCRVVRAQLGVAHLNHVPGDDRDENLKALCNWCHLHYDQLHHKVTRSTRKDAKRPLLQEAS